MKRHKQPFGSIALACAAVLLQLGCGHAATRSARHAAAAQHTGPADRATVATHSPTTLTYLGVAGWSLHSPHGTLLIDPQVTRGKFSNTDVIQSDQAAIARFLPAQAQVVLVTHSHWDHLLDAPSVAARTGAVIVGTESTANVARAHGLPDDHIAIGQPGKHLSLGAFDIQVLAGVHSLIGMPNVPIPAGVKLPLAIGDYGEGNTLQYLVRTEGHQVLFIGSANFQDDALQGLHPDVAVIATGARQKVPDYACRLMRLLGSPKQVYTNHFDAFQEPLQPGAMSLTPETQADLDAFASEIHACAPDTHVNVPVHLQPMPL
ncbi:MAG: MBL fold metallo-hydrolase [Polyangiales bacterium]